MEKKPAIGVFGGTFDPPHFGHLEVGKFVASEVNLERIIYVVANDPWQKTGEMEITNASDRYAMVEILLAEEAKLEVSDIEIALGGQSKTTRTLQALSMLYPNHNFELILGYDAALGIQSWGNYKEIPALAGLIVVDRPGLKQPLPDFFESATRLEGPNIDISSEEIKKRLANGLEVDEMLPALVENYIKNKSIYGSEI